MKPEFENIFFGQRAFTLRWPILDGVGWPASREGEAPAEPSGRSSDRAQFATATANESQNSASLRPSRENGNPVRGHPEIPKYPFGLSLSKSERRPLDNPSARTCGTRCRERCLSNTPLRGEDGVPVIPFHATPVARPPRFSNPTGQPSPYLPAARRILLVFVSSLR